MTSQDFSHRSLRGRSFKGQNLQGANFSHTDIRGADFTDANLKGADFSYTRAGLQKRWVVLLLFLTTFLAIVCGFSALFAGIVFLSSLLKDTNIFFVFLISLLSLLIFCVMFIRENITKAIGISIAVFATSAFLSIALVKSVTWASSGSLIGCVVFTLSSVAGASITGGLQLAIAVFVGESIAFVSIIIAAGFGILTGSYFVLLALPQVRYLTFVWLWVAIMIVATFILSMYITKQVVVENNTYFFIRAIAISVASIRGTRFQNADLTDANFTQATLKNSDFRESTLIHTCFQKTKKLDMVCPGKTYLQNTQLRQLLIKGEGQNKNFDRIDLSGLNLQGTTFTDASFIGANLNEANLQDADLSRAKLVQTQLDGTDFTGATLTGAYIEDWGITSDTKFNGVRCEYIYMRLPTEENPDPLRKPDNNKEVFANGDFGDFIKPLFDTLDLYHNQGVDPRAIAISFKKLAENHPDAELEIVAMEKRGEDKFLLRAKTAVTANKSELSNEYFNTYNQVKGLSEREIQLLVAEKDNRIRSLETMVITALERPSFYAQTYQNQGDTKMSESKYDQRNANNQFVDTAASGSNVTFNQNNYTPEQNLAEAAAEIQQLLKQLEETNPTATESEQISHIEDNTTPKFQRRAANALKAGSETAIDEFILDNKYLKVVKATIKGWVQPDS